MTITCECCGEHPSSNTGRDFLVIQIRSQARQPSSGKCTVYNIELDEKVMMDSQIL